MPNNNRREVMTKFFGSEYVLWPALGADFTPCGIGSTDNVNISIGRPANDHRSPVHISPIQTNTPPTHCRSKEPSCLLPSWQVPCSNEASTIDSVSFTLASLHAEPLTGSEVPARSASMGSADLWRHASTRFTSPICLSLHVTSHSVGVLHPARS